MEPLKKLFDQTRPIQVLNVGLEMFAQSLKKRGVDVVHVDWKPGVSGNSKLASILKKIKS